MRKCTECEASERVGHNFCRACGREFRPGVVRNVRVAVAYFSTDKYCGYCGKSREDCAC